jgi:hypothetical protein
MLQVSENDRDSVIHANAKRRGEKTFTLIERDPTTVETIAYWILKNIQTASPEKLHNALDIAIGMRDFPNKQLAD